jgi:hypothetical protein
MMLEELSLLFDSTTPSTDYDQYYGAIINENVLLKSTGSAREKSVTYLRQLYGLRTDNLLFRTLRELWYHTSQTRPLLAVLCTLARDSLLRVTALTIIESSAGTVLSDQDFSKAVAIEFGDRLNPKSLASIGRNIASTWTQSGHIHGHLQKVRQRVKPDSVSTAYAFFLAYLTGMRGDRLFENDWVRLLDVPQHVLQDLAQQAAKQGWMEYRSSGSITEISFRYFLKDI